MSTKLTASVILCTRNRCNDLIACLKSLAVQTELPYEIIIVDSSDVPLREHAPFRAVFTHLLFPATKLHYLHTKPGLTFQRNEGIRKAAGEIIYFFDDDVILSSSYLAAMQKVFYSYPHYAGGMGDISNINKEASRRYRWFRRFFLLPHEGGSGNFTWSGMPTHPYGTNQFRSVEVVGGCCMAFRAAIVAQFMFDETLHGYCYLEDADIAWRISRTAPLFFNPEAKLEHKESPVARARYVDVSAMFVYNYSYLFFKNWYPVQRLKIMGYWWSIGGLFLQAIIMRNRLQLRGFVKGLYLFYREKRRYL